MSSIGNGMRNTGSMEGDGKKNDSVGTLGDANIMEDDFAAKINRNHRVQFLLDVKGFVSQYHEETERASSLESMWKFSSELPKLMRKIDLIGDCILNEREDVCGDLMHVLKSIPDMHAEFKDYPPDRRDQRNARNQLLRTLVIQMFLRMAVWAGMGEDGWAKLERTNNVDGRLFPTSPMERMVQELKRLAQLCRTYIACHEVFFRRWLEAVLKAGSGCSHQLTGFATQVYQHCYTAPPFTSEDFTISNRADCIEDPPSEDRTNCCECLISYLDAEYGADAGVEGQVSERNPIHPPGVPDSSSHTRKKKRKRKSGKGRKKNNSKRSKKWRHSRANDKKAEQDEGGSRLIINKSTPAVPRGPGVSNDRTCLLEAMLPHIRGTKVKEDVASSFLVNMSSEGDTSISTANATLARYNMVIKRANERYNRGGSIAFHLLQERSCALIVHLRLYDLNDTSLFSSHFVAWDGKEVHDHPKSVRVNNSTDRTKARCNDVFDRLYHKKRFSRWHITSVYELVGGQQLQG